VKIVRLTNYRGKKYHRVFQDSEDFWNFKCNTWYKMRTLFEGAEVVADGDIILEVPERQLCAYCFGTHPNPKIKVSANEGRIPS
jgi:hypothetical protein